jgi:hypothetical protein
MFGNLGQMAGLMKKAQEFHKNLKGTKEELAKIECAGKSADGMVEVLAGGDLSIKKIFISPDALNDRESLEKLVEEAVNNALAGIKAQSQAKLSELTGGIDIPGLFG